MGGRYKVARCADKKCRRVMELRGRGLCGACWMRHKKYGTLHLFPTRHDETNYLLDEYRFMRDNGVPPQELPQRLNMDRTRLYNALKRAKRRNDPRVHDWTGYGERNLEATG